MSVSPPDGDLEAGYVIEPRNKFFEANSSIVEHEMRPGRTLSFLGEVNLFEVDRLRENAPTIHKPTYTAFVVKAVAMALREFPSANRRAYRRGSWPIDGTRVQVFTRRDVAVAIERDLSGAEGTVFIDILRDADSASLDDITASLNDLAKADVRTNPRWREFVGRVSRFPSWISGRLIRRALTSPRLWVEERGGAVLVSSPVKQGVDAVLGTWSHPIGLSFGSVKLRPVVVGNSVAPRMTLVLSLSFDRRIMAGALAGRLFGRIVEILENAEAEMKPYLPQEAPPTREDFPTVDEPVSRA